MLKHGRYYQRSIRENGRVTTKYYGCGEFAMLVRRFDELESERRELDRLLARLDAAEEQARLDNLGRNLDTVIQHARTAAHNALIEAGYRWAPNRHWRKNRAMKTTTPSRRKPFTDDRARLMDMEAAERLVRWT